MSSIWQAIRLHYGFQSTGTHLLDFNNIKLDPDERPEDLYQCLMSFIEDNLLLGNSHISHDSETPTTDEEMSPTLENLIVLTWLRLVPNELPNQMVVKQRFTRHRAQVEVPRIPKTRNFLSLGFTPRRNLHLDRCQDPPHNYINIQAFYESSLQ